MNGGYIIMKVAKFGGTSLATAEQIKKVYQIILADAERKIIVVSAPGKRFKEDIKVTDLLIAYANNRINLEDTEKSLYAILHRYREIAEELHLPYHIIQQLLADLRDDLQIEVMDLNKYMDAIKSIGENYSAKLVALFLQNEGLDAHYLNPKEAGLLVSHEFGNAQVLSESYDNLRLLREKNGILVFPGFFGYSPDGDVVTFPRGGSDITGSILAAAIDAELYENFTDVDSVYAVNPNIIPNPKKIQELTFGEMRELSYAGFSVFNEEALIPAFRAGIPVTIKNTNNPAAPGTKIVFSREAYHNPVVGIAGDSGFCTINVSKYLMNREIGFGRRLLMILEEEGLSFEHTPSGIDHLSVILREDKCTKEVESLLLERIKNELYVDYVAVERNLSLVMIVGEGMQRTVGLASKATTALSKANVNIEMINQGSSELSMMFGIKAEDEQNAIEALYRAFFGN